MRTSKEFWTIGSFVALVATSAVAGHGLQTYAEVVEQSRPRMERHQGLADGDHARKVCKASEVVGMNVRGLNGDDNIGSINDLVIGHDGRVSYAAVSFGGFLGMGDKLFAVPIEALEFVKTNSDAYARIDVTEETLKSKHGFDQDNWPTEADRSFTNGNLGRQAATVGASR